MMTGLDEMIYLFTAIGLTAGGSSTVHIYTQTIHRTTQRTNWRDEIANCHNTHVGLGPSSNFQHPICSNTQQQ